uniref:Uncharacterized protein n=1 Tax=Glossina palpalis gambiensis TaxID=67801 RepID=A0A1B0AVD3_9MUSC
MRCTLHGTNGSHCELVSGMPKPLIFKNWFVIKIPYNDIGNVGPFRNEATAFLTKYMPIKDICAHNMNRLTADLLCLHLFQNGFSTIEILSVNGLFQYYANGARKHREKLPKAS